MFLESNRYFLESRPSCDLTSPHPEDFSLSMQSLPSPPYPDDDHMTAVAKPSPGEIDEPCYPKVFLPYCDLTPMINYCRGHLELQRIYYARNQLKPPAWSQRQHRKTGYEAGINLEFPDDNFSRKNPKRYSTRQTEVLLAEYQQNQYVSREKMEALANKTNLSMLQVKIWFQNRRLKERKRSPEKFR